MWTPGKQTPVHNHAGSYCVMKVIDPIYQNHVRHVLKPFQILRGSLVETTFEPPSDIGTIKMKGERTYGTDEVTYISDSVRLNLAHTPSLED